MKVPSLREPRLILKHSLLTLLLMGCALALYQAYQWHQARYVRPFSPHSVFFEGQHLQLPTELAGAGPVRLLHIWDPSCPCNVGNQQHLAELITQYAGEVEFYLLQKPGSQGQLPEPLSRLKPITILAANQPIPSSPAVAIWDKQGELAYFGPYSEGAVCNSANSFIEPILQAVLADRPVHASNNLATGCFCDWAAENLPK